MISKNATGYNGAKLSLIVFISIFLSMQCLDARIALKIMQILESFRVLHKATDNIPDLLPYIVSTGSVLMWVIYFYRHYKKKYGTKTQFLILAATALPIAYLLKMFFQFMFGRTGTRQWLLVKGPLVFNWFNDLTNGSFPSGHMTVFAAFGTALLIYYPKYRKQVWILLMLLGSALILTDYHFLSDVIAGAYLGATTTYLLWKVFKKRNVTL
jgi:membrane-associated phospholipid phosphatase